VYTEDEVANSYAEILRSGGYEVDVFTDSLLASEKIGSQHSIYSLLVIGWRMPRLSGYELARLVSKIDPEIKIILFSALDSTDLTIEFDHFSMPVTQSELLEMINNKIKYDKFDVSDIRWRHRGQKRSHYSLFRRLWYRLHQHITTLSSHG
jgi:DNA-binding NtrC family response regulator